MPEKAICAFCGAPYIKKTVVQKYCSQACADKAKREREKKGIRIQYSETQCKECGKTFLPIQTGQVYCSKECKKKARSRRDKERKARKRNEKKAAQIKAEQKNVIENSPEEIEIISGNGRNVNIKECVVCGTTFYKKAGNQIYCCKKCKQKAELEKRRERKKKRKQLGISDDGYSLSFVEPVNENKLFSKKCPVCQKIFQTKYIHQKYCSAECRTENERLRELERKKNVYRGKEKTVKDDCKHPECQFRGTVFTNEPCCDYILKRKRPRGQEIDECERWKEPPIPEKNKNSIFFENTLKI